jgi:hypothetical protein
MADDHKMKPCGSTAVNYETKTKDLGPQVFMLHLVFPLMFSVISQVLNRSVFRIQDIKASPPPPKKKKETRDKQRNNNQLCVS